MNILLIAHPRASESEVVWGCVIHAVGRTSAWFFSREERDQVLVSSIPCEMSDGEYSLIEMTEGDDVVC